MADIRALTAAVRHERALKLAITDIKRASLDIQKITIETVDLSCKMSDLNLELNQLKLHDSIDALAKVESKSRSAVKAKSEMTKEPVARTQTPRDPVAPSPNGSKMSKDKSKESSPKKSDPMPQLVSALKKWASQREKVSVVRIGMVYLGAKPKQPLPTRTVKLLPKRRKGKANEERMVEDLVLFNKILPLGSEEYRTGALVDEIDEVLGRMDDTALFHFTHRMITSVAWDMVTYHGAVRLLITSKRATLVLSHKVEGSMNEAVSKLVDLEQH